MQELICKPLHWISQMMRKRPREAGLDCPAPKKVRFFFYSRSNRLTIKQRKIQHDDGTLSFDYLAEDNLFVIFSFLDVPDLLSLKVNITPLLTK